MAGTNVLKTQLDTGEFEMVTLEAAVQDSGAVDVTVEEGEECDDDTVEAEDHDRSVARKISKKCDKETQTQFLSLLTVDGGQCLKSPVSTIFEHILVYRCDYSLFHSSKNSNS